MCGLPPGLQPNDSHSLGHPCTPRLQAAISSSPALSSLSSSVDNVQLLLDAVKASIDELVAALSYGTFHPVRRARGLEAGRQGRQQQ